MSTVPDQLITLQLVHSMEQDVNIFDTDCFGVMWHGAYTKWLEMGRVKLLEGQGLKLSRPNDPEGWIYPVVEQNFKFKSAAWYGDKLTLTTRLAMDGYKMVFLQNFRSHNTDKITLESVTTVVVLDAQWRVQRRLPDVIIQALGLPQH
jgi:acyl-CoA thioester hydrolase